MILMLPIPVTVWWDGKVDSFSIPDLAGRFLDFRFQILDFRFKNEIRYLTINVRSEITILPFARLTSLNPHHISHIRK